MPQPCVASTASVNLTANGAPATLQADVRLSSTPNRLRLVADGLVVSPSIDYATALPASPRDGDSFRWKAASSDTGAITTANWTFAYDQADACWYFTGGGTLIQTVNAADSTASLSYTALTTPGPTILVPFAGDYLIECGAQAECPSATEAYVSFDGSVAAADNWAARIKSIGSAAAPRTAIARASVMLGIPAGVAIVSKYRVSSAAGGGSTFDNRWLSVVPVRITP